MFFRNKRFLRITASVLLLEMTFHLLSPTLTYALTSGPTAPEATNFEPVDTTDLVNTLTGDFTYNTPLLEVPGPEGGYPLSLAYHAGIQPNEEASWVGLGWSLNPGSIARNVCGYPDDQENETHTTHDYWKGGEKQTYSANFGLPGSMTANLSHSQDTYQGFSHSGSLSSGLLEIGRYEDGSNYVSGIVPLHYTADKAKNITSFTGLQATTNFKSISYNTVNSVGLFNKNNQGVSFSSVGGSKHSLTVKGFSKNTKNDNGGRIQTKENNYKFPIPTPYGILTLGYSYQRYWTDEKANVQVNGSLYNAKSYTQSSRTSSIFPTYTSAGTFNDKEFDIYRLQEGGKNLIDQPDPDFMMGGSFPNYDNYTVVAQGLSGSMRPYSYQQSLYSRNRTHPEVLRLNNENVHVKAYDIVSSPLPWTNKQLTFRFQNEFANQYRQANGGSVVDPSTNVSPRYSFSKSPSYGDANGKDATDGITAYDPATDRLASSRHIEYFTNAQILSGYAKGQGFVDGTTLGFNRADNSQIGGYKITNESGMTYHFSLPVYSLNERVYTEKILPSNPDATDPMFNELKRPAKYAYTWYLTAVTGPDYVDNNANGLADAQDWGYWVGFDYGLWANNYTWRNPSEGFNSDMDGSYRTFSVGQKELYYLNAIRTRTHTALFEKEIRFDGKGCSVPSSNDLTNFGATITKATSYGITYYKTGNTTTFNYPKTQLRLNRIILLKNSDLPASLSVMAANTTTYDTDSHFPNCTTLAKCLTEPDIQTYSSSVTSQTQIWNGQRQWGQFVLDKHDVAAYATIRTKSIRTIEMRYDYSLAPGVVNSFTGGFSGLSYFENNPVNALPQTEADVSDSAVKKGKLTLTSLHFLGAGGVSMIPPTKFNYNLGIKDAKKSPITIFSSDSPVAGSIKGVIECPASIGYQLGDVLKIYGADNSISYCTILSRPTTVSTAKYTVRFLSSRLPQGGLTAEVTKNPPYLADYCDAWGLFKSDYNPVFNGSNITESHKTTETSSRSTDAWSLRSISTPLGATINIGYESDDYSKPVIAKPTALTMVAGYAIGNKRGKLQISFTKDQTEGLFKIGDRITVTGLGVTPLNTCSSHAVSKMSGQLIVRAIETWTKRAKTNQYYSAGTEITVEDSNETFFGTSACGSSTRPDALMFGHIQLAPPAESAYPDRLYGGGIRVAKLSLATNEVVHETAYIYNQGSKSSGVTSYDPYPFYIIDNNDVKEVTTMFDPGVHPSLNRFIEEYKQDFAKILEGSLAYAREIPAPGVMYEFVTVREHVQHTEGSIHTVPGSFVYQYEVFKENMVGRNYDVNFVDQGSTDGVGAAGNIPTRLMSVTLKDFTDRIGNLKKITRYDSRGNKLSETTNHFLHDALNDGTYKQNSDDYESLLAGFNYQGVIQECFGDSRDMADPSKSYQRKIVMTRRATYPAVLTGSTTTDYVSGQTSFSNTLGFDFYSGGINKILAIDGYGNRMVTEVTPAYRKYPAMGLKTTATTNAHMLTQQAGMTTYQVNTSNTPTAIVGASASTWSTGVKVLGTDPAQPEASTTQNSHQQKIWRPQSSFAWMPTGSTADGLTRVTDFVSFPFASISSALPAWQKTGEVTLYNVFSNALEAKDFNSNFAATKMGYGNSRVLISGAPATYAELAFSGAEDELIAETSSRMLSGGISPEWPTGTGATKLFIDVTGTSGKTHTGVGSLQVPHQKHGFSYAIDPAKLNPNKSYRASVWASKPVAQLYYWLDGVERSIVSGTSTMQVNGWYLINLDIPSIGTGHSTFRIGCYNSSSTDDEVYFDDFRFQPIDAQAASYVYDQHTGQLTDILDNSNLSTHYEHDAVGRMVSVKRESLTFGLKQVANTAYNYASLPVAVLEGVSLSINQQPFASQAVQATVNQVLTVTANFSVQATTPYSVTYNKGTASFYSRATGSTFTCSYPSPGTYWLKVRVVDGETNQRDFTQKIIVQ